MNLLGGVGLRVSHDLVAASAHNPSGHFEDRAIVKIQQRLLAGLAMSHFEPRPAHWRDVAVQQGTEASLRNILTTEVQRDVAVWGFKDPRTCLTWPLWQDVCRAVDVEPRLVFCCRSATAVVSSLMRTYSMPQDIAEALYLFRTLHALEDVVEPWFFVQYEKWITEPVRQLSALADHCHVQSNATSVEGAVRAGFRADLNRSAAAEDLPVSGVINEIDQLLGSFSGSSYEPDAIAGWCASVRRRLDDLAFIGAAVHRTTEADRRPPRGWRAARRQAALGVRWLRARE